MAIKKKIFKIALILIIVLIVIAGVGIGIVLGNMNTIARNAIVKVSSYVLQVDVKLEKVNISLLGGSLSMEGFVIGNPEGFKTSEAFAMDKIEVALDIKSFKTDEPVVKLVNIENPRVTLEQGFKNSNLKQLMKNASRFESGKEVQKDTPESNAAQKQIKIDKMVVSGTQVSVSAPVLKGEKLSVPVPRIELNDLGGKEPITIAKAIKIFLNAVLEETLKSGSGILPSDLSKDFQDSLESTKDSVIKEGVEGATKGILGIFK